MPFDFSYLPFIGSKLFQIGIFKKKLKTFIDENSSNSGSGGSGATILQAPDGGLWLVTVNNSGVLQTQQVESGTAGTLHLFSPDGTEWDVTVTNAGALVTTAI